MPRQARLDARPPRPPAIVPKSHAAMAMAGRPELATRLPPACQRLARREATMPAPACHRLRQH